METELESLKTNEIVNPSELNLPVLQILAIQNLKHLIMSRFKGQHKQKTILLKMMKKTKIKLY
jgi:hypothetical protein